MIGVMPGVQIVFTRSAAIRNRKLADIATPAT
jgi:hypothetical protein